MMLGVTDVGFFQRSFLLFLSFHIVSYSNNPNVDKVIETVVTLSTTTTPTANQSVPLITNTRWQQCIKLSKESGTS